MTISLTDHIRSQTPNLKKAEQQVARFVSDHPGDVIHMSVYELAEKSGVSIATVVRTCHRLGMSGYQEMKLSLAQDIASPLQSQTENIYVTDTDAEVVTKVFQSAMSALETAHTTLNTEAIRAAVDAILAAKTVAIYGLGNSNSIATDLQHKLMRLGINAISMSDGHLQLTSSVYMHPGDVLFTISHSGSSRELVDRAAAAKKAGIKVISLTSIAQSPLYRLSDIGFCTHSLENEFSVLAFSSRVAQLVIVNSIYAVMAVRKEHAMEDLRKLESVLSVTKY